MLIDYEILTISNVYALVKKKEAIEMKAGMIRVTFIMIAGLLLTFSTASAYKPTAIKMNYDLQSQSLSVWVGYHTGARYTSYVKTIEIKVNGKTCQKYNYTHQAFTTGTVTHSFKVEANPGDVIEVTATSSTTNESLTKSLTVEKAGQ